MQSEFADMKAGEVAETDILVMDELVCIAEAAKTMRQKGVSSVIVSRTAEGLPAGMVTERDILYRVVAENRGPFKTPLKDVMTSPLVTIDESASVRDAIVLMRKNGIRRLPVTKAHKIVGMLSLQSVIGNSPRKSVELIAIEPPGKVMCPYCESKFESKEELSNHIDRLHLGSGLLEGDLRKW